MDVVLFVLVAVVAFVLSVAVGKALVPHLPLSGVVNVFAAFLVAAVVVVVVAVLLAHVLAWLSVLAAVVGAAVALLAAVVVPDKVHV